MTFRDTAGNVLNEQDIVVYPLALGACALGTIVKIDPGIGNLTNTPQPGFVLVQVNIPLGIDPAGFVNGIFKAARPLTAPVPADA